MKTQLGLGLEITELRLGLPGGGGERSEKKKRVFCGDHGGGGEVDICGKGGAGGGGGGGGKNRNMDLVVGWPPVCLYRKKSVQLKKMYVKVSMDGAPILRKIDLSCFEGYSDLGMALEKLFNCHGIGESMKKESESGEYVAIYEDKDGDWMLVGDVPWEMFIETCKRLGIKKRSDANGIELCK